ncbi:MAG: SH3 domain-containing protein [Coriobacteriia bacterium]|nr:SH3 domain-containing protein [Coriobacteriia bacterium]
MNLTGRLLRVVAAVVALALVAIFVMSYWGHYRDATEPARESTATVGSSESTGGDDLGKSSAGEADSQTVLVLTDGLNFRESPTKDGKLIRGLEKGDKLTYLETDGDWYKVRASDGAEGYVTSSDTYTKLQ